MTRRSGLVPALASSDRSSSLTTTHSGFVARGRSCRSASSVQRNRRAAARTRLAAGAARARTDRSCDRADRGCGGSSTSPKADENPRLTPSGPNRRRLFTVRERLFKNGFAWMWSGVVTVSYLFDLPMAWATALCFLRNSAPPPVLKSMATQSLVRTSPRAGMLPQINTRMAGPSPPCEKRSRPAWLTHPSSASPRTGGAGQSRTRPGLSRVGQPG